MMEKCLYAVVGEEYRAGISRGLAILTICDSLEEAEKRKAEARNFTNPVMSYSNLMIVKLEKVD